MTTATYSDPRWAAIAFARDRGRDEYDQASDPALLDTLVRYQAARVHLLMARELSSMFVQLADALATCAASIGSLYESAVSGPARRQRMRRMYRARRRR